MTTPALTAEGLFNDSRGVYIKEHGQISNAEYKTIAEISSRTATRELKELKEKGILAVEGSSRGTIYKIIAP